MNNNWIKMFPGAWKLQIGECPVRLSDFTGKQPAEKLKTLQETDQPDFPECDQAGNYTVIRLALQEDDHILGCGLLFQKVVTDHQVYHLKVDHFAGQELGSTHAPIPFAAISNGLGIFCNTPAKTSFYIRTANRKEDKQFITEHNRALDPEWSCYNPPYFLEIAVQSTNFDLLLFRGQNLKDCVARFNLFCGGGFIPPKWGLGLWHRTNLTMKDADIRRVVQEYKEHNYSLSVIGLEPGWQSNSYPCTYDWSKEQFPDPPQLIDDLKQQNVRVNLWENPYISERSTLYEKLYPLSGSHLVWGGIVPDYTLEETRKAIQNHHKINHVDYGISGYKLDESDGYDKWLWPDHAQFPSGLDGATYRNLCGLLFQRITYEIFHEKDQRTYGLTRSTNAGGVAFPYVVYNDRYDFREYVNGLCSCGMTGVLWCPEVRGAQTADEWIRRFQLVGISPMLLLNAWANDATPWMFPEAEQAIRDVIALRQKLMPYLYSAFARYHFEGIPPYRPLVMDYGFFTEQQKAVQGNLDDTANPYQEVKQKDITDQFIVGDYLMAAPVEPGATTRNVIFPPGKWYDFHSGKCVTEQGGVLQIQISANDPLPLFAPDGAVIPLQSDDGTIITKKFGTMPGSFLLYDDDGETFAYERGEYTFHELRG